MNKIIKDLTKFLETVIEKNKKWVAAAKKWNHKTWGGPKQWLLINHQTNKRK